MVVKRIVLFISILCAAIILMAALLINAYGMSDIRACEKPITNDDNYTRKTNFEEGKTYIVFTFDDGYISDYESAYKIFQKYGIRGTSFIIPEYADTNREYALSWDNIKEMHKYGWDFQCHTYGHSNLLKLSKEQIVHSIEKVNKSFKANGLPEPKVHAFPFGKYNNNSIDALISYRKMLRKAYYDDKLTFIDTIDLLEVNSVSCDLRGRERFESRKRIVDKAVEQNAIVIFRTHCIYKKELNDSGSWPVQTNEYYWGQIVDYCVSKGCEFITMAELLDMVESYRG